MNYKDWIYEWLENYVKLTSKIRTYNTYKNIAEIHLVPKFGEKEVNEIDAISVQKFVTELTKSGNIKTGLGLSSSTVNMIISVIQGSLKTAFSVGIAEKYEMNKIRRPRLREKQVSCFSVLEQKQIENEIMNNKNSKMRGIIICLYTGVRIGELLALEWSDVDLDAKEISITKTCFDGVNEYGKFCRITNLPKTNNSIRKIPIPSHLLPILTDMKSNAKNNFVVEGREKTLSVRSYQRSFERVLNKLNIEQRGFHALRHTFATRAIEIGVDVKTLSEILGHKNANVTLQRYTHSLSEHKIEMMNRIGNLL